MKAPEQEANTMKMILEKLQRYGIIKLVGFIEVTKSVLFQMRRKKKKEAQIDKVIRVTSGQS